MKKIKYLLVFLLALVITGAGCVKTNIPEDKTQTKNIEPVKIGMINFLTGPAAEYGASIEQATRMFLDEVNGNGGILGRKVEIVMEDTKCETGEGSIAASKLYNTNKVDLVVSSECSGPTISAANIAQQNKKIMIVATATAPDIASIGDYVFRITPSDTAQGKDLAKIVNDKGYEKIGILYLNNDYGLGVKNVFSNNFNGEVVSAEAFGEKDSDFRTQLTKIRNESPDTILLISVKQSYLLAFKQMSELGIDLPVFASETFKDEGLLKDLGNLAEGTFTTYYNSKDTKVREDFMQKFEERFGTPPTSYTDFAYDGLMTAKIAIEKAGSTDPEKLKEALKDLNFEGVTGTTSFDEEGEVKDKAFTLFQVQNGKFVEVK